MEAHKIYTIIDSKKYLRKNYVHGVSCPSCGQLVKLYKRKLNSGMARVLVELYLNKDNGAMHVKEYLRTNKLKNNHDWTLLSYWGLITTVVEDINRSKESGYWNITLKGIQFVEDKINVHKHVLIYNKRFTGFSPDYISIYEALGDHFDYKELMNLTV